MDLGNFFEEVEARTTAAAFALSLFIFFAALGLAIGELELFQQGLFVLLGIFLLFSHCAMQMGQK